MAKIRLSKHAKPLSTNRRVHLIDQVTLQLLKGEITQGEALKSLRMKVLGLKQAEFSELIGVSRRVISDIENNVGNYSVDKINKLFKPFGLKLGLVPSSYSRIQRAIDTDKQEREV